MSVPPPATPLKSPAPKPARTRSTSRPASRWTVDGDHRLMVEHRRGVRRDRAGGVGPARRRPDPLSRRREGPGGRHRRAEVGIGATIAGPPSRRGRAPRLVGDPHAARGCGRGAATPPRAAPSTRVRALGQSRSASRRASSATLPIRNTEAREQRRLGPKGQGRGGVPLRPGSPGARPAGPAAWPSAG